MTVWRGARNAVVLVITPVTVVPVLGALALGLQVPAERVLPELPPVVAADYASRFETGFSTLSEGYLRQVLGPAAIDTPGTPPEVGSSASPPGREGTSLDVAADEDPLADLEVGGQREVTPGRTPTDVQPVEFWRSKGASISADGTMVSYTSTDTRVEGMDIRPCATHPPGPTAISVLWYAGRGEYTRPPPDPGPCDQIVVQDLRTGETAIASVNDAGELANSPVHSHMISGNGRFIVFATAASNLVPDDTNDTTDVFVRDLVGGRTELISVSVHGGPIRRPPQNYPEQLGYPADQEVPDVLGSVGAETGSISHDGRYVFFESSADDLVADDTPQSVDVFVRDRLRGTTERLSRSWNGETAPREDVRRDNNWRLSNTSLESAYPCPSPNGRYVAFRSQVSNLVPGDTNARYDVFLHDRTTGRTELATVSSSGEQHDGDAFPATLSSSYPWAIRTCVSDDGRYVLFESNSTNLVEGDTNDQYDVFLRDRNTDTTRRISLTADGTEGRVTGGEWVGYGSALSPDGAVVAFVSWAQLTDDDPDPEYELYRYCCTFPSQDGAARDLFAYDIATAALTRLDVREPGSLGRVHVEDDEVGLEHGSPDAPSVSRGGSIIAFHTSFASPYPLKGSVQVYRWRDP